LIGSTEWGEDFSEWIKDHVVAYINTGRQDWLATSIVRLNFRFHVQILLPLDPVSRPPDLPCLRISFVKRQNSFLTLPLRNEAYGMLVETREHFSESI
jgi:hypothetical protein